MKIKLVKFEDLDCDGTECTDYGLIIGCEYKVTGSLSARGVLTIINGVGEEVTIYAGEYEVIEE